MQRAELNTLNARIESESACIEKLLAEIGKIIIGQKYMVERLVIGLLCNSHILLEGVPGLAKTTSVQSLASAISTTFKRIQFTPDLLPADLIGTLIYNPQQGNFYVKKGPIFANIILADEINRTPPKTQAALLESMQEHQVTAAGHRHPLPQPFFVLATQNPIEMEGTYPLPEAQLDRFMFNVYIDYLPEDQEVSVVQQTTSDDSEPIQSLFDAADVLRFNALVRKVPVAEDLARYAVRLAAASRPHQEGTPDFINEWISWGAGLRAAQFLVLGAKARTLIHGRSHVTIEDIQALASPVLRHRILVNYRAEAEGMTTGKVIEQLLETVPSEVN